MVIKQTGDAPSVSVSGTVVAEQPALTSVNGLTLRQPFILAGNVLLYRATNDAKVFSDVTGRRALCGLQWYRR